jgi:hypothetical protein
MIFRLDQPIERLVHILDGERRGLCNHCQSGGEPSIVMIEMHATTFQYMLDRCSCLVCGQRYYLHEEDIEQFFGWKLHPINIYGG